MLRIKEPTVLFNRLNRFTSCFGSVHTVNELTLQVEELLDELLEFEFSGLYLYDFREKRLKLHYAKGFNDQEKAEAERTAWERHPGNVFRSRTILNVPDAENDPEHRSLSSARSFTVRSRVYVPVMNGTETIGVFGIVSSKKNNFSEESIAVLSFVCNITGVVYANLIKQSELRLTSLIAQETDNVVIITGRDGLTEWVNRSFERVTGFTFEEIKGRAPGELLQGPETDKDIIRKLALAIEKREPIETHIINYHKDGHPYWVSLQIQPVFNALGELTNFISIQRDITDQKRAQDEMESVTTRLSTLIRNMHYGILMEDQNRRIALVNNTFCDMFGIPVDPELLTGSDCSDSAEQSKHLFRDPQKFVDRISEILAAKIPCVDEELELADGRVFERDYVPILLNDKFLGNLWQYREITARKKSEIHLRKAIREAESANAAKSLFLAKMSHEIRTPLNAIIGLSKIMRDTPLNQEQKKLNSNLILSGENLLGIITEILDFSKIEAGKIELESIPFSIRDVIKRVYSFQEHAAEEKMITLSVSAGKNIPPALIGDPVRLQQVLTNLVSNAIKFTLKGGVEVVCNLLSSSQTRATVRFSVTDSGIGISEENIKTIFEPFIQEDESVTRMYGGTGLGLAISQQLVQHMGGRLRVESIKGKGSSFFFDIGFEITDESLLDRSKNRVLFDGKALAGKKILVVEDNEFNQFIAKSILERWGAAVGIAGNGQIALEQLWLGDFDLVLMDMHMPVMDGISATRSIRNDLKKKIPIIALTANVTREAIEKAMSAGMNNYISKPFDEEDLYVKILTALGLEPAYASDNLKSTAAGDDPPETEPLLYDLSALSKALGNRNEQMMQMLEKFIEHVPAYYQSMINSFENGDFQGLSEASHKIKSSADLIAARPLRELIRNIYALSLRVEERARLTEMVLELKNSFPRMISQLERLLSENQDGESRAR